MRFAPPALCFVGHKRRVGACTHAHAARAVAAAQMQNADALRIEVPDAHATEDADAALEELRELLRTRRVRVLDLWRSFDIGRNQMLSAAEFRRGIASLGYDASPTVLNELVHRFGPSGKGELSYQDLQRLLHPTSPSKRSGGSPASSPARSLRSTPQSDRSTPTRYPSKGPSPYRAAANAHSPLSGDMVSMRLEDSLRRGLALSASEIDGLRRMREGELAEAATARAGPVRPPNVQSPTSALPFGGEPRVQAQTHRWNARELARAIVSGISPAQDPNVPSTPSALPSGHEPRLQGQDDNVSVREAVSVNGRARVQARGLAEAFVSGMSPAQGTNVESPAPTPPSSSEAHVQGHTHNGSPGEEIAMSPREEIGMEELRRMWAHELSIPLDEHTERMRAAINRLEDDNERELIVNTCVCLSHLIARGGPQSSRAEALAHATIHMFEELFENAISLEPRAEPSVPGWAMAMIMMVERARSFVTTAADQLSRAPRRQLWMAMALAVIAVLMSGALFSAASETPVDPVVLAPRPTQPWETMTRWVASTRLRFNRAADEPVHAAAGTSSLVHQQ